MCKVDYHNMDVKSYATSHEMWDAMSDRSKAKLRRQHRGMSDDGVRNWIWRRRHWDSIEYPKMARCQCTGKLHRTSCANAVHNGLILYGTEKP